MTEGVGAESFEGESRAPSGCYQGGPNESPLRHHLHQSSCYLTLNSNLPKAENRVNYRQRSEDSGQEDPSESPTLL